MSSLLNEKKPILFFFPGVLLGAMLSFLPWFFYAAARYLSANDAVAVILFLLFATGQIATLVVLDLRNRARSSALRRCLRFPLGYLLGAVLASGAIYLILFLWGDALRIFFANDAPLAGLVYFFLLLFWIPILAADALWVLLSAVVHWLIIRHRRKAAARDSSPQN